MIEKNRIVQEIDKLSARLSVARNKLLSEIIDDEKFLDIKWECKERIEKLEEQLSKDGSDIKNFNIDKTLDKSLSYIQITPNLYKEGKIQTKRSVISSIFPKKLAFNRKAYQTTPMNVIADQSQMLWVN